MAIIGSRNQFVHAQQWYLKLANLERQVCRVESIERFGRKYPQYSTGFLVGPDIVLVAYHGLAYSEQFDNAYKWEQSVTEKNIIFRFDYTLSQDGSIINDGVIFKPVEREWLIDYDPYFGEDGLDYALIRVDNDPGLQSLNLNNSVRGWVEITESTTDIQPASPMSILQYPQGAPLQIAIDTQAVVGFNDNRTKIYYRTNTEAGSSGAPCFDLNWRLIAVHQGIDVRSLGQNMGIPIDSMVNLWKQKGIFNLISQKPPIQIASPEGLYETALPSARFALEPGLLQLIADGESQLLEFKESIRENIKASQSVTQGNKNILKTVAGFMNSDTGGTLIIGISKEGAVVGIDKEYKLIDKSKQNWDGYSLFLNNLLRSSLSIENPYSYYSIARYNDNGKDICVVSVKPADKPVWVEKGLFLRVGNQTIKLEGPDLVNYIQKHWEKNA